MGTITWHSHSAVQRSTVGRYGMYSWIAILINRVSGHVHLDGQLLFHHHEVVHAGSLVSIGWSAGVGVSSRVRHVITSLLLYCGGLLICFGHGGGAGVDRAHVLSPPSGCVAGVLGSLWSRLGDGSENDDGRTDR